MQIAEGRPVLVGSDVTDSTTKWQALWPKLQLASLPSAYSAVTAYTDPIKAGLYDAAIIPGPDWSAVKADGLACGVQAIGTVYTLPFVCSVNPRMCR